MFLKHLELYPINLDSLYIALLKVKSDKSHSYKQFPLISLMIKL